MSGAEFVITYKQDGTLTQNALILAAVAVSGSMLGTYVHLCSVMGATIIVLW